MRDLSITFLPAWSMPKGKYEGLVYYIPSGMVRKDEKGIRLRLPEDFEVHLKDKSADENIDIKPDELEKELKDTRVTTHTKISTAVRARR